MQLRPFDCVQRRLEELLRRVLLANVLVRESSFGELFDEVPVTGEEVVLGEAGIVDERLVLEKENVSSDSHHVAFEDASRQKRRAKTLMAAWLPRCKTDIRQTWHVPNRPPTSFSPCTCRSPRPCLASRAGSGGRAALLP